MRLVYLLKEEGVSAPSKEKQLGLIHNGFSIENYVCSFIGRSNRASDLGSILSKGFGVKSSSFTDSALFSIYLKIKGQLFTCIVRQLRKQYPNGCWRNLCKYS